LNIETKSEEFYGEVKEINIKILKIENIDKQSNTENTIQKIDNVEINISDKTNVEETIDENIKEDELEELKEYLSNEYGTGKEKIHINE